MFNAMIPISKKGPLVQFHEYIYLLHSDNNLIKEAAMNDFIKLIPALDEHHIIVGYSFLVTKLWYGAGYIMRGIEAIKPHVPESAVHSTLEECLQGLSSKDPDVRIFYAYILSAFEYITPEDKMNDVVDALLYLKANDLPIIADKAATALVYNLKCIPEDRFEEVVNTLRSEPFPIKMIAFDLNELLARCSKDLIKSVADELIGKLDNMDNIFFQGDMRRVSGFSAYFPRSIIEKGITISMNQLKDREVNAGAIDYLIQYASFLLPGQINEIKKELQTKTKNYDQRVRVDAENAWETFAKTLSEAQIEEAVCFANGTSRMARWVPKRGISFMRDSSGEMLTQTQSCADNEVSQTFRLWSVSNATGRQSVDDCMTKMNGSRKLTN